MIVDGGKPPVKSGAQTDDLAQYHLDDYDDDVNEKGARRNLVGACLYSHLPFFYRNRSVHEHQRVDVLPR